jgi:hypothetical protein
MGIFDWLRTRGENTADDDYAAETLERIVQLANPRLRFARNYKKRLTRSVRSAMEYATQLIGSAAPARDASKGSWQTDPCIRAFFATAEDLGAIFSRSPDVRTWFWQNPGAQELCAVLSMQLVERRVLGAGIEGGVLRHDVAQTTVSFTDHRVRICAASEAELRKDLERRVVDQLALTAIATAADDQLRRAALEQERALLRTRMRLLDAKGAGLSGLALRVDPEQGQLARIQMELAQNEANLRSLAAGFEGLEHQLEQLTRVLASPAEHFSVSARRIRVDNMNIMQPEGSTGPCATLDLQIARVPVPDAPPEVRTFVLVHFPRAELLHKGELFSDAARMVQ